jgi:hypothetical protein
MSRLLPHMQKAMPGAKVELWEYGFMGFWQARWRNAGVAKRLAKVHKETRLNDELEVWFTHSNGAAIAYLATTKYGATPDMIININPALDRHLAAPVKNVEIVHSKGDRWVYLSQFLPFHIWGDQGKAGYKGDRDDVICHNASLIGGRMAYDGHCDMFTRTRMRDWAYFWANRIDETLPI